jgi:sugar lactone lactonase YvrE
LANLSEPYSVAVDASGNLYIAEKSNNDIRKVTANGIISTLVGNGNPVYGGDGGAAVSSSLKAPTAVALDKIGNLYIADYGNNRVRKVDINGIITTIAGNGTAAYAGDGGLATAASINGPISLAIDATGNIYIAEYNTSVIRMVNNKGIITTVAGSGSWGDGGDGGLATAAQLFWPSGVAIDVSGNLYIADTRYGYIRKVNTNGIISRVVGKSIDYTFGNGNGDGGLATSANIYGATGITVDVAGNLFIADSRNNRIRIVGKNGIINTIAGNGGNPDGYAAVLAGVSSPNSTTIDLLGNLYIADVGNNRVRKIANVAFVPTTSPTISSFTPKIATNETIVTIKGIAFTGTSSVTFGGMSAYSFNVVNDSVITAIIATGTSGNVSVSNAIGSSILSGFIYYDKPVTKEISLVGCDSIIYNGKIYQLSIAKTDTLKNYLGYDSIYNKATLSVNQSPILSISGGTVPRSDNTILTAIVNNRVNTSTYRYIKFTSTYSADNGQVNVYEIQAFKNGINVALNKPGYANSYEGGGSWNSNGKNVNDGSSSRWSSDRGNPGHANTTIPVFIVIDLQQVYTVDSVLLNIAGFDNHKQTFTLQVSTDSVSWSTIGSGTNITGIFTYQLTSNNFLWSTGATTQSITVNSSGIYSIKITDINGCLKTAFYTVNMALPLNITAFSANTINQNIKTEWQTASEQNTDYFIIQRSTDGISFTDIGTLKAIGSGANKYAFTDKNPNNGINYYRLQNVDKDGSFTYSKVVNANINDKKYFSISPNPASDFAIINFGKTVEKATLLVCDITGKVLITQTIPGNSNTYKLNIQTLTNGFYVIRVNTSTASFNEKLIIQK